MSIDQKFIYKYDSTSYESQVHNLGNNKFTVIRKLRIVDEAYCFPKNIKPTAPKSCEQLSQIRAKSRKYVTLESVAERSPLNLTVHTGGAIQHPELESQLYDWVTYRRAKELAVSTGDIRDKAISIDPSLKNGDETKPRH